MLVAERLRLDGVPVGATVAGIVQDLGAERLGLEAEADLRPYLPAQRLEVDVVRGTGDCGMQGLVGGPGCLAVGSFDVLGEGALDRRDVVGRPALRGSAGAERVEEAAEVEALRTAPSSEPRFA